jgi:hypothetical protein
MKTAKRFELKELIDQFVQINFYITKKQKNLFLLLFRCEVALISSITVRNCLKFYKVAEEIGAQVLQTHCSQLISTHWVYFICSKILIILEIVFFRMILPVRIFNIYLLQ